MERAKATAAYAWVGLLLLLCLFTFLGSDPLARTLVSVTGMTIAPRYSGGEVARTADYGTYQAQIHRPVFDGLFSDHPEGFIQITWGPLSALPPVMEERVDLGGPGKEHFTVRVDRTTGTASLLQKTASVTGVRLSVAIDNGWLVRVGLKKNN